MPIEKHNITKIRKVGATYVVIPSITIRHIKNADSLAVLVYLLDKPEDWVIRRGDLIARFSFSKARCAKAMRHLHDLKLAWWHTEQAEGGTFKGRILCITADLQNTSTIPLESHREAGIPEGREKPSHGGSPSDGESRHLHSDRVIPHSDISTSKGDSEDESESESEQPEPPKPKKPGPRKLPDDWEPKEETVDRFVALGMTLQDPHRNLAEFIDYWRNSAKRKADWDTTYFNHLKRSFTYETNQRKANNGNQTTNSTQLFADRLQKALASDVEPGW